jgi:hypothetical protein
MERELAVVEVALAQDPDQIIGVARGRCITTEPAAAEILGLDPVQTPLRLVDRRLRRPP